MSDCADDTGVCPVCLNDITLDYSEVAKTLRRIPSHRPVGRDNPLPPLDPVAEREWDRRRCPGEGRRAAFETANLHLAAALVAHGEKCIDIRAYAGSDTVFFRFDHNNSDLDRHEARWTAGDYQVDASTIASALDDLRVKMLRERERNRKQGGFNGEPFHALKGGGA